LHDWDALRALFQFTHRARDLLGRQINPTIYTLAEFNTKRAAKDHFLTEVLSKPKLFILGSDNELVEAAG
jgi:hypothetical protein